MNRLRLLSVVLVLLVADISAADLCDVAAPGAFPRVEVDARNGSVTGVRRFSRAQEVELVVRNMNPFRYTYTVKVEEKPIVETDLATFIGFLGTFPLEQAKPAAPAIDPTTGGGISSIRTPAWTRGCDPDGAATAIYAAQIDLANRRRDIEKSFVDASLLLQATTSSINEHRAALLAPDADCESLQKTASSLLTVARGYTPALATLKSDIDAIAKNAAVQEADVRRYMTKHPACHVVEMRSFLQNAIDLGGVVVTTWRANVDKLEAGKKGIDDAAKRVADVLARGSAAFTQSRVIGGYDVPHEVAVTISRKNDNETPPDFGTALRFGGPKRFVIAAGLAGAALDRTEYRRVQGFAIQRDGTPVVANGTPLFTTVVGTAESSSTRITPAVVLHGRLLDAHALSPVSLHFTLGLTAKVDGGIDVEYLVGPSIGLLENRLFLTVGAYGGRVQSLDGGLYPGAAVPESLAEIPVRKDLEWQLGFSATFKVR